MPARGLSEKSAFLSLLVLHPYVCYRLTIVGHIVYVIDSFAKRRIASRLVPLRSLLLPEDALLE
jgi:hypothetical protein